MRLQLVGGGLLCIVGVNETKHHRGRSNSGRKLAAASDMTDDNRSPTRSSWRSVAARFIRGSTFPLGAALLTYLLYRFGSARVWMDLRSIGWRLGVIVGLEIAVSAATARGWWHTFPGQSRRGCFGRLFALQLAGSALNETTPGAPLGGEPVKLLLLRDQFPVSVTAAALLSAKLAQALARALFVILGIVAASWTLRFERLPVRSLTLGFALTVAGVAAFMALQLSGFSAMTRRLSRRLPFLGGWVEPIEHGIGRVDAHLQELYRSRPLDFVASVGLGLGGLCLGVVQIWLMMRWIGLRPDWLSSLTIEAFSVLVGFVMFAVPGSLGVQEGGKVLIFAALGLPVSAGLSIGVAFRLNNLVTLALGFVVLAWLRPQSIFQAAPTEQ
jgi:uncharacterized protein (TIRG00374 family)